MYRVEGPKRAIEEVGAGGGGSGEGGSTRRGGVTGVSWRGEKVSWQGGRLVAFPRRTSRKG